MVVTLALGAGCSKEKDSAAMPSGPDPEVAKIVGVGSPDKAAEASKEPASPMVIPPPPVGTVKPAEPDKVLPATVKVVNFASFETERESYRGKYLVIDGWATWCGICKEKFPKFIELQAKYGQRDNVAFASIANDPADKEEDVKEFLASSKSSLTTFVLDEDPADFASTFDVNGVPAYLIYDPEGKLIFRAGKVEELADKLAELLADQSS
jgi:thiol-disulfide isomerase/thioredoxin